VKANANLGLIHVLNSHKEKRRILRLGLTSEKLLLKPQGEVNCGQICTPKLALRGAVLTVQTLISAVQTVPKLENTSTKSPKYGKKNIMQYHNPLSTLVNVKLKGTP
jgi:hypothetical protein